MEQHEMVALIRDGVPAEGGVWADLGAGTGNFTWALAAVLGPAGTVYALDRDARAIAAQQARIARDPPGATVLPRQADVLRPLELPLLDGILMANLLHFVRDQVGFLRRVAAHLRPTGRFLIVEYEQPTPIPWVPHPLPYARLADVAAAAGLRTPTLIGTRCSPSSGRVLYAAVIEQADSR
jgi:ubiquinone/menaquinone biosynthesis C-methylase UbiE